MLGGEQRVDGVAAGGARQRAGGARPLPRRARRRGRRGGRRGEDPPGGGGRGGRPGGGAPLARFAVAAGEGTGTDPLRAVREAPVGPAAASQGRLLLSVDDGHLLDDASAALVHELCASGAATVLVTLRSREPSPDGVTALWKDELCERIELQPLAPLEVDELLALVLGGPVDNTTVHALADRSRGNVLHLRELVRGGLAAEALRQDEGLWSWHGEVRAPPWLVELVELLADRLDGLDASGRRALGLVTLGEPLAFDQIAALATTGCWSASQ